MRPPLWPNRVTHCTGGKGLVKGRAFDAAVKSFWYSRRKAGSSLCNPTKNMGSLVAMGIMQHNARDGSRNRTKV